MAWTEVPEVTIYSDGGAEPNPGKGGFGVIMCYKNIKKEFSQGYVLTTNNRMELMGVIYGLERLKTKSIVNVFTDSQYVINGIEKGWAAKWKANNWYRNNKDKAINYDLWDKLLLVIKEHEKVTFNWVKGHAGHAENERCDELANMALNNESLINDTFYEENLFNETGYEILTSTNPTLKSSFQAQTANVKIKSVGDPCRKCGAAVVIKPTRKKEVKPGQTYYFEYYLFCPGCKTMYMVEEAKRAIDNQKNNLFT